MKKYFILAAVALTMAACSNDEGANIANDGTIRLTTGVKGTTRTIDQTVQATQIVNGGSVVAEFTSTVAADITDTQYWNSTTSATATYTADGNGNLSGSTVKWPKTDHSGNVSIKAWAPFTTKPALGTGLFAVKADQSTEANYAASDYLYGTCASFGYSAISSPVLVTFSHMLAKINVNVTMSDGSSVTGAKVVFGPDDLKLDGTIAANSSVSDAGSTASGAITMATLDANATASCIIIPQTIAATKKLFTITLGSVDYTYTLTADKTYDATKAYTYNVTIADAETIILSEQITDWTYETAESVIAKQ